MLDPDAVEDDCTTQAATPAGAPRRHLRTYLQVPHMRALGDLDFRDVIGRKRNDLLRTAHGCRRFHYALRQVLRDYGFEASNADSEWYRRALVSLQAMQTFATNRCVLGRLSWRPRPVPSSYADIQPAWAL